MNRSTSDFLYLGLFLLVVLAVGFTIGFVFRPGEWYLGLNKPFFTPPGWVFGPVWTIVYILIAVAGWRTFVTEGTSAPAFRLWLMQMLLNWAWTPVFFGAQLILPALVIIIALLATTILFMISARDRIATACFAPYALWLTFAGSLNLAVAILN
jgi:tryptophan-rich sensory protein